MGWIAVAAPQSRGSKQKFRNAARKSIAADENPDALLENGAIHLSRHANTLQQITGKSRYSDGLSPAEVAAAATVVKAPDLKKFLSICAEYKLGLQYHV